VSDARRGPNDDDPVLRRIARILDAKRRDNEEALGALKAADRSWDKLSKEVDQEIGKEFDLLGAEERAVKAARGRLDKPTTPGLASGTGATPVRGAAPERAAEAPSLRDSLDESIRSVELRGASMRSAHTALTRFSALTRESLETLREELAAEPPELRAAIAVAGIEPPEPVAGGGDRPSPTPRPPATSTPLEHVRGIGPKRAEKLRAAGVPDLEAFLRTDSAKLAEIAGLDADVAKEDARRALEESRAAAEEKRLR